jgi:hypothetical protein
VENSAYPWAMKQALTLMEIFGQEINIGLYYCRFSLIKRALNIRDEAECLASFKTIFNDDYRF